MRKKVFDITPPHTAGQANQTEMDRTNQSNSGGARLRQIVLSGITMLRKIRCGSLRGRIIGLIGLLGLIGLIYLISFEHKTEIEIWPKTEIAEFEVEAEVVVDKSNQEGFISGELLEVENSLSREFSSSGTFLKEGKAKGVIRVYNNFSQTAQVLIATTRFISNTGKLFRTPKKVVIPGMFYEEGKLVPGLVDIEVLASEPGEEYNIGPATFSIPGFAGTERYTAFYGKSFSAMTGGARTEVFRVVEKDLEEAEKVLTDKVLSDGRIDLENKIGSDFEILEEAVEQEVMEFFTFSDAGQEAETFIAQIKAKTRVIGFKKSDIVDFSRIYVETKLSENQKFKEESLEIDYSFIDPGVEEIKLNVKIKVLVYLDIDKEGLKKRLQSRNVSEIPDILKDEPGISGVRVKNRPFWARRVADDLERIEINIRVGG